MVSFSKDIQVTRTTFNYSGNWIGFMLYFIKCHQHACIKIYLEKINPFKKIKLALILENKKRRSKTKLDLKLVGAESIRVMFCLREMDNQIYLNVNSR